MFPQLAQFPSYIIWINLALVVAAGVHLTIRIPTIWKAYGCGQMPRAAKIFIFGLFVTTASASYLQPALIFVFPSLLWCGAAALVDQITYRLPNRLLYWGAAYALNLPLLALCYGKLADFALIVGSAAGIFLVFLLLMKLGLGAGDAKLAPITAGTAAFLGTLPTYLLTLMIAPALGLLIRWILSGGKLPRTIPYGPWLVVTIPLSLILQHV